MLGGGNAAGLVAMSKGCTFDNIKTLSTAYSGADYTWKPWLATTTKVSSVTANKCPKLFSSFCTYSSRYKRLVLKNNKEK